MTIAGVVYAPKAPVSISGNAVVTINRGAGTGTLPPIFAAMIAYDAQVTGNGVLTINPDDPPASGSSMAVADERGRRLLRLSRRHLEQRQSEQLGNAEQPSGHQRGGRQPRCQCRRDQRPTGSARKKTS